MGDQAINDEPGTINGDACSGRKASQPPKDGVFVPKSAADAPGGGLCMQKGAADTAGRGFCMPKGAADVAEKGFGRAGRWHGMRDWGGDCWLNEGCWPTFGMRPSEGWNSLNPGGVRLLASFSDPSGISGQPSLSRCAVAWG